MRSASSRHRHHFDVTIWSRGGQSREMDVPPQSNEYHVNAPTVLIAKNRAMAKHYEKYGIGQRIERLDAVEKEPGTCSKVGAT